MAKRTKGEKTILGHRLADKEAGRWRTHFFKRHCDNDPFESVPGREFLEKIPEKVRAMMLAVVRAVTDAPPPAFSGGASGRRCMGTWQDGTRFASTARSATTTGFSVFSNETELASGSAVHLSSSSPASTSRS
jgi:hypothetical protein